jgi:hypothetical protein
MKKLILALAFVATAANSGAFAQSKSATEIQVGIDLVAIKDDKVTVTVTPPKFTSDEITYHIPKTVPGTYSANDYGKFIDNFKALDKNGVALAVAKTDDNSENQRCQKAVKITYEVNDTYDTENTHDIFSPAGSNIEADKNIMLNTHAFVGYFSSGFAVSGNRVASGGTLGATSMTDLDPADTKDVFRGAALCRACRKSHHVRQARLHDF